jgi:ferredoxin
LSGGIAQAEAKREKRSQIENASRPCQANACAACGWCKKRCQKPDHGRLATTVMAENSESLAALQI